MAVNPRFPGHLLKSRALLMGSKKYGGLYELAGLEQKRTYDAPLYTKANSPHTLELYLDYVCPFSKKQFMGLYDYLKKNDVPDEVRIIFRHQVQPWHPSSTLVHEAALATALQGGPCGSGWFWPYSYLLFDRQTEFFDVNVVNETRNQTYLRLADLYKELFRNSEEMAEDPPKELLKWLTVSDKPEKDGSLNIGNKVTDDLKLCIKLGRQTGIHVSPTVLWDGLVEGSINSKFGEREWTEFFEKHI